MPARSALVVAVPEAEPVVGAGLPVEGTATEVLLLVDDEGRWRTSELFPLSRR